MKNSLEEINSPDVSATLMNPSNQPGMSRRDAIRLGSTVAAISALPAIAQNSAETNRGISRAATLPQDPGAKYPKPPFQEQSQPWPGLAGKMNPRPDHGEESYRGSGRLAGRKALITGGDS